jgi:hypothetical protein
VLPFLKKYKPIEASTVARAMINLIDGDESERVNIIENTGIFEAAKT